MSSYDGEVVFKTKIDESGMKTGLASLKSSIASALPTLGFAGFSMAILGIGNAALQSASKMEDFVAAFTPLTGSAENAKDMIAALNKEAATTPFELSDIANTAKQLLPVLGNDISAVTKTFRMLGDAAGGNAQKLDSIARGYVKVMNTGKVSMEALNMISDAGVPIQSQLAKSMGISVENMYDLSSQGKITAADLTKTFQTMTKEGGLFFNGMEIASQTFSGKMSTMTDNLSQAAAVIGNQLLPAAKAAADAISGMALGYIELNKQLMIAEYHIGNVVEKIVFGVKKTTNEIKDDAYVQAQTWKLMTERGNAMLAADEKRREKELAAIKAHNEAKSKLNRTAALDYTEMWRLFNPITVTPEAPEVQGSSRFLGTGGPLPDFGQLAYDAGQIQMPLTGVKTLLDVDILPTTEAIGESFKEVEYTVTDGVVASLSVASHLLQKMGTDDTAQLAIALTSVASIMTNMAKASAGDPMAIASVAIAGIDLVAQAWDVMWGNETKAQKEASKEARKAEKERLDAVKALNEEYNKKTQSELKNLETERDKAIAEARRIGADVLSIERYYAGEISKINKAKAEVLGGADTKESAQAKILEKVRNEEADRLKELAKSWGLKVSDNGVVSGKATAEQVRILGLGMQAANKAWIDGLEKLEGSVDVYKDRFSSAFEGLGSAISSGLKNGLGEEDISDTINTMIKNLAIDAAVAAAGFQDSFATIGKMIADALTDGVISSSELSAINVQKNLLTAKAMSIGDAINQVFGSGSYSSNQSLNLNLNSIVEVDGLTLATATLRYTDSVLGRAYGS